MPGTEIENNEPDDGSSDQKKKGGATFGGWREPSGEASEEWSIVLIPKGVMPHDDDSPKSPEGEDE
jgi:hypothetical protein